MDWKGQWQSGENTPCLKGQSEGEKAVSTDDFSRGAENKNCQVKPCVQAKFLLANPFLTCQHELGLSPPEKSGMCGGGRECWICLS